MSTKRREEVCLESTWDLTPIYRDDQAFDQAFAAVTERYPALAAYRGRLAEDSAAFAQYHSEAEAMERELEKLYVYSSMRHDQDTANSYYSGQHNRVKQLLAKIMGTLAFVEPELAAMPKETFERFVQERPELELYRQYMAVKWKSVEHVLSDAEEAILARSGEVLGAAYNIFSILDNADQRFPVIKDEKGEDLELTHANFIQQLESRDRTVREAAFKAFYSVYRQFRNSYAGILQTAMKSDNLQAELHKFSDAREAALFQTHIPVEVHEQLIQTVGRHLPLLHRYMNLRKKLLGVSELHCYDLYTPLVDEVDYHFSIDEARDIIFKALEPLGPEYHEILRRAFAERWIDYADNQGKRSGAYSGGCYDSAPYILISWRGTLDNLFTLAHELGHSCHSFYTRSCQQKVYGDYGIFLAEIASTTNENLLTQYLLKTEKDPARRKAILIHYLDGFKGTVFRQTQFAEFEHWLHQQDQAGVPLTADLLCETYAEINRKYYGEALQQDEEIALEWGRIPHFYYNYYVFQYATGFSAATAFSQMILQGGETERERYLDYLRAGSSAYPIDVLKRAGLDMSTPEPIEKALEAFESYLNEVEKLS